MLTRRTATPAAFPPVRMVLCFLCLCLMAGEAHAAGLIAVLPLDVRHAKGKLDADAQAVIEEMLRDVSVEQIGPLGWTVLTGETTLSVIRDNGIDPAHCGEGDCALAGARELKVDLFISGTVQYDEGEFTASIRLIDTKTGRIAATERLEGSSPRELRKEFESKVVDFFTRGGLLGAQTAAYAPPPKAVPAPPPRAAPVAPPPKAVAVAPPPRVAAALPPPVAAAPLKLAPTPAQPVHEALPPVATAAAPAPVAFKAGIAGLVVGAGAIVAGAAVGILGLTSASKNKSTPSGSSVQSEINSANSMATIGVALLGSGAAVGGAGVTLMVVFR